MAIRTEEGWIRVYKEKDALWIHDGNMVRPHARLTSGKHSTGFFNSRLVIPDEVLLREAASDLLEIFVSQGGDIVRVEGVVGPQTGATKLAEWMAYAKGSCFWASPAKSEKGREKLIIFSRKELDLLPGQSVLLCEDVLTTGGSVELTATAVTNAGGIVLPFVAVLVNRSGLKEIGGRKIVALIDRDMPTWFPEECPLCKQGSKGLFPKDPANWALLNATYPEKENI